MAKHSFTHYFVQSQKDGGRPQIVGHSQDKKTKEIYYKFFDRKRAMNLLQDEKVASPEYKYRLVKETHTFDEGAWL